MPKTTSPVYSNDFSYLLLVCVKSQRHAERHLVVLVILLPQYLFSVTVMNVWGQLPLFTLTTFFVYFVCLCGKS